MNRCQSDDHPILYRRTPIAEFLCYRGNFIIAPC